jgi:hypothetical protein
MVINVECWYQILPWYFKTLEKVGTAVNYHGIFITLAKNTIIF